ncbi:MAG: hypothetical protein Q7R65_04190 [bacterium]|nr:hypothetical protein [bacterium]
MRRWLCLILVILCLIPVTSSLSRADDNEEKKPVTWQLRDFYYYDANGIMVQLYLAPKLLVRFRSYEAKEKRSQFLAEFSPVAEQEYPADAFRMLIEFDASIKPDRLIEVANKILRSGLAEASPVFFNENIESVIEGITVEPKTILTSDRLQERMKKYGDFSMRQTISENGAWIFLLDDIKPPLNILALINLMHNDSWVRRASPRFKFLHDPIIASIVVEPVSGTVGEVRTITFTIKVFDPAIKLLEDQLPQFGVGLFMPIQGNITPSSIKYPPGYLFEVMGDPIKHPVRMEKRSRTFAISWKFKHHALGEWTISSQPVSYSKNGVESEIKSSGFTMVVNSQIGSIQIMDMPIPRTLIYPVEKPTPTPDLTLPPIPSYWFDPWLPQIKFGERYAKYIIIFLVVFTGSSLSAPFIQRYSVRRKRILVYKRIVARIDGLLQDATEEHSYEKYNEALSLMLTALFPHLSSHPTWEEIKDDALISKKLGVEIMKVLEETFYELDRRHSRNFTDTVESLARLDKNIRKIKEVV